jgi:hypothetical protein
MTISRRLLLAFVGVLALAGQASAGSASRGQAGADQLCPLSARVVTLGTGSAVVYYTYDDSEGRDLIRVVTTIGTDPDGASPPARFVSYLTPGQKAEVSVAGPVGTEPAVLELVYDNGRLAVHSVAARPDAHLPSLRSRNDREQLDDSG